MERKDEIRAIKLLVVLVTIALLILMVGNIIMNLHKFG